MMRLADATEKQRIQFERQIANCEAKATFKSRGEALIYAHVRLSRPATKGKPASQAERLWAYRCPICDDWHLTSKRCEGFAAEPKKVFA